jgi:hypothetical protein
LENLNNSRVEVEKSGRELGKFLDAADVPGMVSVLMKMFYSISYDDHLSAQNTPHDRILERCISEVAFLSLTDAELSRLPAELVGKIREKKGEGFYRSIVQAALFTAGEKLKPEKHVSVGRSDLEVVYGGQTYIIELKIANDAKSGDQAARSGMRQMNGKGYGLSWEKPVLVSIAIGRKERNIVACLFKVDKREVRLSLAKNR